MAYIYRNGYRTISLSELINRIRAGTTQTEKNLVLTFDDGYKNNFEVAYPILERYGFTATIFTATSFIGGRCSWTKHKTIPELPMMRWKEIEHLHHNCFDIQPHSSTHPYLTELTDDKACQEIIASKQKLERRLGKLCDVFCYPYGDFDERIIALVQEAGFLGAVTIDFGRHNTKEDIFRLKRLGSARFANSFLRFKAALFGIYDIYLGTKKWLSHPA